MEWVKFILFICVACSCLPLILKWCVDLGMLAFGANPKSIKEYSTWLGQYARSKTGREGGRPQEPSYPDMPSTYRPYLLRIMGVSLILCIGSYFLCKPIYHTLVYDVAYKGIFGTLFPLAVWTGWAFALAYIQLRRRNTVRENTGMSLMTAIFAVGLVVALVVTRFYVYNHLLAKQYVPEIRNDFPIMDIERERDMPFENVVTAMQKQVGGGNFTVMAEHTTPTIVDGTYGYAGLISATRSTMQWSSGPGIVKYKDGASVPVKERVQKVSFDKIPYAPERKLFNDLQWRLKSYRFWGDFEPAHLVQLVQGDDTSWHFASPYTVHRLRWPGILVEEWGGVVFVKVSTGEMFEKTPDEIRSDKSYAGLNLFPISLTRKYVEVRNYDSPNGLLYDIWQWIASTQYEIEISEFGGYNQQPITYPAANNKVYQQVVTEPLGSGAQTSKKIYFVDGTTGEFSVFVPKDVTISPGAAESVVRDYLGHIWGSYVPDIEDDLEDRERPADVKKITLEPKLLSLDGKTTMFKVAVTSTEFPNLPNFERVFVDSSTSQPVAFKERDKYMSLLRAGKTPFDTLDSLVDKQPVRPVSPEQKEQADEFARQLKTMSEKLDRLEGNQSQILELLKSMSVDQNPPADAASAEVESKD